MRCVAERDAAEPLGRRIELMLEFTIGSSGGLYAD
jgi:hypothetical protein